ncbi:MAG: hypothetical protein KIT72_09865 [Polyangiaceae bacterium]|nr:hypothetical protein [Polyangiaceae bacterium]MCW5790715.1 hypothetical protein [Polyangiaceae bacterium]
MLPPFIIEQIRRLEEEARRQREGDQPRLELPLDSGMPRPRREREEEKPERGVVILDIV